jgi:hypothetical protein
MANLLARAQGARRDLTNSTPWLRSPWLVDPVMGVGKQFEPRLKNKLAMGDTGGWTMQGQINPCQVQDCFVTP